jgi:hypothetical protein
LGLLYTPTLCIYWYQCIWDMHTQIKTHSQF